MAVMVERGFTSSVSFGDRHDELNLEPDLILFLLRVGALERSVR
jgi:hypothetical protein